MCFDLNPVQVSFLFMSGIPSGCPGWWVAFFHMERKGNVKIPALLKALALKQQISLPLTLP